MRFLKSFFISILVISFLLGAAEISNAKTEPAEKYENVAVVLVIDSSGSMEKTDPQKLRGTAANIFIDLLSPDDYLGIITFHTAVDTVAPLEKIRNRENRTILKEKLYPKLVSSGDTNYQLALSEAQRQLDGLNEKDIRKVILFITDGKPDPDPARSKDSKFMSDYMNTLWKTVSDISIQKYPVYSVAFGDDINPQLLQKISAETGGEYLGINDSAELASSFFTILSNLKNRNVFLNTEYKVTNEQKIGFDFDKYTSQVTFVFIYPDNNPIDISLIQKDEKSEKGATTVNKTNRYTTVTMNQSKIGHGGSWEIKAAGNGVMKAFGAKDLYVKTWIKSPASNSVHSVNTPIVIEAFVTGGKTDQLHVEAQINKNGIDEAFPIVLKSDNGVFKGVYKETDQAGNYNIDINVYQSGKLVTNSNLKVFVKVIPSLETDFQTGNHSFVTGHESAVTSWLNIKNNKLIPSNDLSIEYYKIMINYEDGKTENIVLNDDGNVKKGDILAKDGIYSAKFAFSNTGKANALLIVKGIYKNEDFVLDKKLGSFEIYPPGMISIVSDSNHLYGRSSKKIDIPLIITNTSAFTELLSLSVDQSFGIIPAKQIPLDPNETTKIDVPLLLGKNLSQGVQEIPVNVTIEESLAKLKSAQFNISIRVVSGSEWYYRRILDFLYKFAPLLSVPFVIFLLGMLLYRILVYPKTIVQGVLHFHESYDTSGTIKEIKLKSFKKSTVVISMNGDQKRADYSGLTSKYQYNLLFVNIFDISKWKFIEGYKALNPNYKKPLLFIKTTEPGIFQCGGLVYTKKELYHGDIFESAGYTFQYLKNCKTIEYESGKNLLEGRI